MAVCYCNLELGIQDTKKKFFAGDVIAGVNNNILIVALSNSDSEETGQLIATMKDGLTAYDISSGLQVQLWT